jgi:FkbM family methyltransferase
MATLYCRWCDGVCNWEIALRALTRNGFVPRTIIDVGACRGDWTNLCRILFPDAAVLMIEPLEEKREYLETMALCHAGVSFMPALLGSAACADVPFYEQDFLSSVYPMVGKGWTPSCTVAMQTLDEAVAGTPFAQADLVKIHVQGSEHDVLAGAEQVLGNVEVAFLLVSLIELYDGAPAFHDIEMLMAARGFRLYDVVHFYHREFDGALAQMDAVYVKNNSQLLARKGW